MRELRGDRCCFARPRSRRRQGSVQVEPDEVVSKLANETHAKLVEYLADCGHGEQGPGKRLRKGRQVRGSHANDPRSWLQHRMPWTVPGASSVWVRLPPSASRVPLEIGGLRDLHSIHADMSEVRTAEPGRLQVLR